MDKFFVSDETINDLLFTLEICERALPAHAHPEHFHRLDLLRRLLRSMRKQEQQPQQKRLFNDEE